MFEKKQRTSVDIISEMSAAIQKAITELAERNDITMEAIHTNATRFVPTIAMLIVGAVGRKRMQIEGERQASGADVLAHGPSNVVKEPKRSAIGRFLFGENIQHLRQ